MSKAELRSIAISLTNSFLETGGVITVAKQGKRNMANTTYRFIRADTAYRGGKANALRKMGYAKAVG